MFRFSQTNTDFRVSLLGLLGSRGPFLMITFTYVSFYFSDGWDFFLPGLGGGGITKDYKGLKRS